MGVLVRTNGSTKTSGKFLNKLRLAHKVGEGKDSPNTKTSGKFLNKLRLARKAGEGMDSPNTKTSGKFLLATSQQLTCITG